MVCYEAFKEGGAGGFVVFIVAFPSEESRVLEGASETKGDWPGVRALLDDGGEVVGGLFDSLPAREEDDAGEVGWDVIFEDFGGAGADF